MKNTAHCSVVTASMLEEFRLLWRSFSLFHGEDHRWFVRCDSASEPQLSRIPGCSAVPFTDDTGDRPSMSSEAFRNIILQKAAVMSDAWAEKEWETVVYWDADILITADILAQLRRFKAELVLSPNYYPPATEPLAGVHGIFNSGFVCTRTPSFHDWWQKRITSCPIGQPFSYVDQLSLNNVFEHFTVETLGPNANIGFWSAAGDLKPYVPFTIPHDCMFLHGHFLRKMRTSREWQHRILGLHALQFLVNSDQPLHNQLYKEILQLDTSGWYAATLSLSK